MNIEIYFAILFLFFLLCIITTSILYSRLKIYSFLNMVGQSYLSPTHFNTLTFEPSSSARILAFLFLGFLRMEERFLGYKPDLRYLWNNQRTVLLAFLYVMVFMGSGTAMIALVILSFYFVQKKYLVTTALLIMVGYMVIVNGLSSGKKDGKYHKWQ